MRHIQSKAEFYQLSRANLLGNRLKQWTWKEFIDAYRAGLELPEIIGVRHVRVAFTNKGTSGLMPLDEAMTYGEAQLDKGNLLFDEGAVHGDLTIQGEVSATERGLYVRYSHLQCHQRTLWHLDQVEKLAGLSKHQIPHNWEDYFYAFGGNPVNAPAYRPLVLHAFGLEASILLQKYMDDHSWEMLNSLLGCQLGENNSYGDPVLNFTYPVVEFACFNKPIGVFGWNTLFWEIRTKY
jgi:hypothetical protein